MFKSLRSAGLALAVFASVFSSCSDEKEIVEPEKKSTQTTKVPKSVEKTKCYSDNPFMMEYFPRGTYSPGHILNINWGWTRYGCIYDPVVKIKLVDESTNAQWLLATTSGTPQYSYTPDGVISFSYFSEDVAIPASAPTSRDYYIVIEKVDGYTSESPKRFSIINPSCKGVQSPDGGESQRAGTPISVTWCPDFFECSNVSIELYKGSSRYMYIVANWSNTGSYTGYIPSATPVGSDYKVVIRGITTASNPNSYSDDSDNYFSIVR